MGVSPFFGERDNQYSFEQKVVNGEYPPLTEAHFSHFMRDLLDACLQVDQARRPSAAYVEEYARRLHTHFRKFTCKDQF